MLLFLLVVGQTRNLQNFPILQVNIFVIKWRRELVSHTLFFVRLFMCNSDHLVVKLQCLSTANNRAFRTFFLYSLLPLHYPGGCSPTFSTGKLFPEVQFLLLLYVPLLTEKGTLFVYLPFIKWCHSHIHTTVSLLLIP